MLYGAAAGLWVQWSGCEYSGCPIEYIIIVTVLDIEHICLMTNRPTHTVHQKYRRVPVGDGICRRQLSRDL